MAAPRCRVEVVDGDPVLVRGSKPMNDADREALAEVVRAAKELMASEPPEQRAAREERARAVRERFRADPA